MCIYIYIYIFALGTPWDAWTRSSQLQTFDFLTGAILIFWLSREFGAEPACEASKISISTSDIIVGDQRRPGRLIGAPQKGHHLGPHKPK